MRVAWSRLLASALHDLRLGPHEFWALTPVELRLMLGGGAADLPMGRTRLDELMAAFPDAAEETQ